MTITAEERAEWHEYAELCAKHHPPASLLGTQGAAMLRLLDALEEAETEVRECEEGWTDYSLRQEKEAPLTKRGRAAWWATIEQSVQRGSATGHTAMMEIAATDVQRFLELIEAAEAKAEKAETALSQAKRELERVEREREWLAGECAGWAKESKAPALAREWWLRQAAEAAKGE